jgi:TIR domain
VAQRPTKIFINYRQVDTGPEVRSLSDYLKEAFGRTMVFVDTTNVGHGPKWPPQIKHALKAAGVLLVAVGPTWFNKENRRRLNTQSDWVRMEIAKSLERGIPIFPLLINGAGLPRRKSLPTRIAGLNDHQAIDLGHKSWDRDVSYLIGKLVTVGCRRLPVRIILMDSHKKIYERKPNRVPEEMNSHVIRRQLESLSGPAVEIEPVHPQWEGESGILARNPSLIIIHYSCLDEDEKTQRLRRFLDRILGASSVVEVIVYSRTNRKRSAKNARDFDVHVKAFVATDVASRVHGLAVFKPKSRSGRREAQTFDDPDTANDLRALVRDVLTIED